MFNKLLVGLALLSIFGFAPGQNLEAANAAAMNARVQHFSTDGRLLTISSDLSSTQNSLTFPSISEGILSVYRDARGRIDTATFSGLAGDEENLISAPFLLKFEVVALTPDGAELRLSNQQSWMGNPAQATYQQAGNSVGGSYLLRFSDAHTVSLSTAATAAGTIADWGWYSDGTWQGADESAYLVTDVHGYDRSTGTLWYDLYINGGDFVEELPGDGANGEGNAFIYTATDTSTGQNVTLDARGYAQVQFTGPIVDAKAMDFGQYGLGVCDAMEPSDCPAPQHAADSDLSQDYVAMVLDNEVEFLSFDIGFVGNQNARGSVRWWIGSAAPDLDLAGVDPADLVNVLSDVTTGDDLGAVERTVGVTGQGNVLIVAPLTDAQGASFVKISAVHGRAIPPDVCFAYDLDNNSATFVEELPGTPFGNVLVFADTDSDSGELVSAEIRAYSAVGPDFSFFSDGQANRFNNGIGVCSTNEGAGCAADQHTLDNQGGRDAIVAVFDHQVDFADFEILFTLADADVQWWIGSGDADYLLTGITPAGVGASLSGVTFGSNNGSDPRSVALSGTGNVLIIATPLDQTNDGVKIDEIRGCSIPAPDPASLGDRVWKDLDGNGLQDAGEPGVDGITVNLWTDDDGDGSPDTQINTTTTDSNGFYGFDNLDPSLTYVVQFINDPSMNMPFTSANAGDDLLDSDADPDSGITGPINLAPGENNTTIDAGLVNAPASLGDKVWKDLDGDGLQGADEPSVAGITVNLWTDDDGDGNPDTQIDTTATDSGGMYGFADLDPTLTYVVQFVNDPDMNMPFTTADAGDDALDSDADPNTGITGPINLGPGENNPTIDAGLINAPASLGDKLWKDLDGDGLQGTDEPGVAGITVNLWTDDDGDGTPDTQIDSTSTDGDGMYLFDDLDASLTYVVQFINDPSMNMPFTIANAGDDTLDSDADPNTGITGPINLQPGEFNPTIDAGLINATASLGDFLWKDLDEDGLQGSDEPGVPGIVVNLWTDDDGDGTPDTLIDTTTTDNDGMYGFDDLDSTLTYVVQFVNDPDMNMPFTTPNNGDDAADSDAAPGSGFTGPIDLAPGENNNTIDAGLINLPAALGDFVWKDLDGNGQQDAGEPGVQGIVVNLWTDDDGDGTPDTLLETTTTGIAGGYVFQMLDPTLTYIVEFVNDPAMNMPFTAPNEGDDETDSDADPTSGLTGPIQLTSGEFNMTVDAGLVNTPASIGDFVWKDLNGDGLQSSDEPGIPGIVVNLWTDDNGDGIADTLIDTTSTDGDGMYGFGNLDPTLTYVVQFVNDPDMNMPFTTPNNGDDAADSDAASGSGFTGPIDLAPGENNNTIDAGLINLPAALGDFVWKDLDSNGQQDPGEPGVQGIVVNLWTDDDGDGAPDTLISTTTTGVAGGYVFQMLDPTLTYIVEFVNDPAMNMPFTVPNEGDDETDSDADPTSGLTGPITLGSGDFNMTIDAGLVNLPPPLLASVGDKVWKDLNDNGQQDTDEPGVGGITVNLWTDDDGDGTPDTLIDSTSTDSDGMYGFTDLDPSLTYIVEFVNDPAMNMPFTDQGVGDPASDSNADPDSGLTGPINLAPGENNNTIDAGLVVPPGNEDASLGDYVWIDSNEDGIQGPDEPPVASLRVRLFIDTDGDGEPDTNIRTTNTDGTGFYRFDFLDPGVTYWVFFDIEGTDLQFTLQDIGADDLDSDVDPNTGFSGPIVLGSGEHNPTIDAGVFKPDVLDVDRDGVSNELDNCEMVFNWQQIDADGDGYGNRCDADFDNNCMVDFVDMSMFKAAMFSTQAMYDLNSDGNVDWVDLSEFKAMFLQAPGPNGTEGLCGQ